jgi:hypothetical protein
MPIKQTENDRIHKLCARIAAEKDRAKLLELVEELNCVLRAREQRLADESAEDH